MARPVVQLDGRTLSCCQVRDVARDAAAAAVTGDARERAQAAARTVAQVAASGQVYGRYHGRGRQPRPGGLPRPIWRVTGSGFCAATRAVAAR